MAESKMGEEEAHCNPELEMIKEGRKNVNVTPGTLFFFRTLKLASPLSLTS